MADCARSGGCRTTGIREGGDLTETMHARSLGDDDQGASGPARRFRVVADAAPADTGAADMDLECPLRHALAWASGLAERTGLTPVIDSGSLLGLQRDGTALPFDPDLDLALCLGSEGDLRRLQAGLAGIAHNLWVFEGRPFKIEIESTTLDLPLAVDIKLFRATPMGWVCPSVYPVWRGRTGSANAASDPSLSRRARAWLRRHWRRAMAQGDPAHWPLRGIMHADAWVVPEPYFSSLEPIPGFPGCARPAQWEQYLNYRYGDWQTPVSGWVYWRDDGAYRCLSADGDRGHVDDLRRLWACS